MKIEEVKKYIRFIGIMSSIPLIVEFDEDGKNIAEAIENPTTVGVRLLDTSFVLQFKEGKCYLKDGTFTNKNVDFVIPTGSTFDKIIEGKNPYFNLKNRKFCKNTLFPIIRRVATILDDRSSSDRVTWETELNLRMVGLPVLTSADEKAHNTTRKLQNGEIELKVGKSDPWTIIVKDYNIETEKRSADRPVSCIYFLTGEAYLEFCREQKSLRELVGLGEVTISGLLTAVDPVMRIDRRIKFFL